MASYIFDRCHNPEMAAGNAHADSKGDMLLGTEFFANISVWAGLDR